MRKTGTLGRGTRSLVLVVLSAVLSTTAIRIELLNHEAGGVLPSRELRDDGTPVTWRQALWTHESRWREIRGPRDENGEPVMHDLTETERSRKAEDVRHAQANNSLRGIVATWGLAQYLLVPASLALAFSLLFGRRAGRWMRVFGGFGACIAVAAGALVFYRGYFSSLGL